MDNNLNKFKKYLTKEGVSTNSIKFYASDVRVFIKWIKKTTDSEKINNESFESYASFLKSSGLPPQSVNRKLSSLRKFAAFLSSTKKLPNGILKITNKPKDKDTKYVNIQNIIEFVLKSFQSSLFFFMIILILGMIIILLQGKGIAPNFVGNDSGSNKLDLPQSVDFRNDDYQKNLGKVASSSPDGIKVDQDPLLFSGKEYIYGRSQIEVGTNSKKIFVPGLSNGSVVFVTPLSPIYIFISEQGDGYFIVSSNTSSKTEIKFNWMSFSNELPIDTP